VDENRSYLRDWLPWLDANRTSADSLAFIRTCRRAFLIDRQGWAGVILENGRIAGTAGFNKIDHGNKKGEIGYWIAKSFEGKGLIRKTVTALCELGFGYFNLNRIEIRCATGNVRSRKIPESLGFQLEGILRQNERLYGRYVDHAVYSKLRADRT
jgi:ribosomal-protein-serine acetyltransferase